MILLILVEINILKIIMNRENSIFLGEVIGAILFCSCFGFFLFILEHFRKPSSGNFILTDEQNPVFMAVFGLIIGAWVGTIFGGIIGSQDNSKSNYLKSGLISLMIGVLPNFFVVSTVFSNTKNILILVVSSILMLFCGYYSGVLTSYLINYIGHYAPTKKYFNKLVTIMMIVMATISVVLFYATAISSNNMNEGTSYIIIIGFPIVLIFPPMLLFWLILVIITNFTKSSKDQNFE